MVEHDKVTIKPGGEFASKRDAEKEWVLETDGINLKKVMCIDGVNFTWTWY